MVTETKACWQSAYTKGSVSSAPLTVHVWMGGAFGHVCVQRSREAIGYPNLCTLGFPWYSHYAKRHSHCTGSLHYGSAGSSACSGLHLFSPLTAKVTACVALQGLFPRVPEIWTQALRLLQEALFFTQSSPQRPPSIFMKRCKSLHFTE